MNENRVCLTPLLFKVFYNNNSLGKFIIVENNENSWIELLRKISETFQLDVEFDIQCENCLVDENCFQFLFGKEFYIFPKCQNEVKEEFIEIEDDIVNEESFNKEESFGQYKCELGNQHIEINETEMEHSQALEIKEEVDTLLNDSQNQERLQYTELNDQNLETNETELEHNDSIEMNIIINDFKDPKDILKTNKRKRKGETSTKINYNLRTKKVLKEQQNENKNESLKSSNSSKKSSLNNSQSSRKNYKMKYYQNFYFEYNIQNADQFKPIIQKSYKQNRSFFTCPICGVELNSAIASRHIRLNHPKENPQLVSTIYRSQKNFRKDFNLYECRLCKKFVTNIYSHLRSNHNREELEQELLKQNTIKEQDLNEMKIKTELQQPQES